MKRWANTEEVSNLILFVLSDKSKYLNGEKYISGWRLDKFMKNKIIGFIPIKLNSKRLSKKALLNLKGLPLFVHVYRRAKFSKMLDDLIVCCDDKRVLMHAQKHNVKCMMTKKNSH